MTNLLMLMLSLVLFACNKTKISGTNATEKSGTFIVNPEDIDPKSLQAAPTKLSLSVGELSSVSITGLFPYNKIFVLSQGITWEIADTSIASINSEGKVKALKVGETTISATYRSVRTEIPLKVIEAIPMQIVHYPFTTEVERPLLLGQAQAKSFELAAGLLYTDGTIKDTTDELSWETPDTNKIEWLGGNQFSAKVDGEYILTARLGTLSLKHKIIVTTAPARVSRLEISSSLITLKYGDTYTIPLKAYMEDGEIRTQLSTVISQSSTQGLSINGLQVLANQMGRHIISLNYMGKTLDFPIVVEEPAVVDLSTTPAAFQLSVGQTISFVSNASFSNSTTANVTSAISTSILNSAVASVAGNHITALANGSTNLVIQYQGFSKNFLVNVGNPSLQSIEIRPSSFSLAAGEQANFQVFGLYSDGSETNLTSLATSRGVATSKADTIATGVLLGKVEGTTKLSSVYIEPGTGRNFTASSNVTITPALLQSIVFEPTSSSKALGRYEDFRVKGRYSDNTEVDITAFVNITVDVESSGMSYCASVTRTGSNRIRVTGVRLGSQTIQATYSGVTGSALFTATPKELDRVNIVRTDTSTNTGQITKGQSATFIAQGTFSDSSIENITNSGGGRTVTWNPPDSSVATLNSSGSFMTLSTTLEGSASFSVTVMDSVTTKSDSFNLGVFIPCSSPGVRNDYYCWYLGDVGVSCQTACGNLNPSRSYQSATRYSAGSDGSDNTCRDLIQDRLNGQIESQFNTSASASTGIGCAIYTLDNLNIGIRQRTMTTTSADAEANFRRVCSCE